MSGHQNLRVVVGESGYDILVGDDLIGEAGRWIAPLLKRPKVFVVADEQVCSLHLETLARGLSDHGIEWSLIALPPGEACKSFDQLAELVDRLLAERLERSDLLLAFGGGVIGDLAGFAAAIALRGIGFVQIPTTLLAQVDSSVGGKTGINTSRGKNLVGTFHQPLLVLADSGVLSTLPRRELLAGYAEVVKYGLIQDESFFAWLEGHGQHLLDGDHDSLRRAVLTSCRIKAEVVAADEREAGRRALLNLGHTFGHALEAEVGYGGELLHGEAVAIGMVMAFDLSAQLGLCPAEDAARVRRHLAAVGLPTSLEALPGRIWDPDRLLDHMSRDKKVEEGRIGFVLARRIGEAYMDRSVPLDAVRALLYQAAAA